MTTLAHGPASSDFAVDVTDLSKVYGGRRKVHALRGVTMQIERGGIFGLLGPNGAGKSTLVKVLMTVIRPSAGSGHMLGKPIGDKSALRKVGYLPEHHKFPEYLTAAQVLDYFGALADVPGDVRKKRSGELLALVGIDKWADHKVRNFSKGMRQRLGIANALMNDPDFVVLDEPTDGVDPVGRREIRDVLLEIKRQGRTVLLNSHLLSELEMVSDRVAILVQGRVVMQGTIDELTRESKRYEITVAPTTPAEGTGAAAAAALTSIASFEVSAPPAIGKPALATGKLNAGQNLRVSDRTVTVETADAAAVQPVIDALRARGLVITAISPARSSLEDLFMQAVTDPGTGQALKPGAANVKA